MSLEFTGLVARGLPRAGPQKEELELVVADVEVGTPGLGGSRTTQLAASEMRLSPADEPRAVGSRQLPSVALGTGAVPCDARPEALTLLCLILGSWSQGPGL